MREGQVCHSVAMIRAGLVRYYINEDGNEGTYYFSTEGDFVCDYESFLPQIPSSKNIQALEDTSLYLVNYEGLQQIYRGVKQGERLGRLGIEQVFITVLQQLSSFYKDSPDVRYQRFLTTFSAIRCPSTTLPPMLALNPNPYPEFGNEKSGLIN